MVTVSSVAFNTFSFDLQALYLNVDHKKGDCEIEEGIHFEGSYFYEVMKRR
jgi:hypothetical protein